MIFMSGITGIFRRDGQDVEPADIMKINDKLSHRGINGSKIYCEGPVALGHQMLYTTPESHHEILPCEDNESGLVITADARIDNRKDLSSKLGIQDNEFVSDSYFIIKAYEKWGEKCLEELLGDFAFVIWDKKNQKLFCARDHMGIKPFYYFLSNEVFVFATEIKSLLELPDVPFKLDEIKLAYFLQSEIIEDDKLTFYENIWRLPPSHYIIIDKDKNETKNYWKLEPDSTIILNNDEDYIKKFRKIFHEAVYCRMRSVYLPGFDLSGGLDSSSVVCMAKEIYNTKSDSNGANLKTFSYVFQNFPESDERFYIDKVVEKGGIDPYYITGDEISPLGDYDMALSCFDQPYFTPFLPLIISSFKKMHENNIRTFFSGHGGDSVIYAGNNFLELAYSLQCFKLIKEIKNSAKVMKFSASQKFINTITSLISRYLKDKFNDSYQFNKLYRNSILSQNFIEKNAIIDLVNSKRLEGKYKLKENHYRLICNYNIRSFEILDAISAYYNLVPVYPYFDKRLVEFCYSMPSEMKFRSWNRYTQRMAMDGIIPPEVQWRVNKANLREFLTKNMLLFEKNSLDLMITNDEILGDYVDLKWLKQVHRKYTECEKVRYTDTYYLWISLILFIWFQKTKITNLRTKE